MAIRSLPLSVSIAIALTVQAAAAQQVPSRERAQTEAAADRWAAETEAKMTDDERFSVIHGFMALRLPGLGANAAPWPADVVPGAGYIPGVPRLGVPSLRETDASLGVTNPFGVRKDDSATALPAGLALGGDVQSRPRLSRRQPGREGSARARIQRPAWWRHQPHARSA